MAIDPRSPDYCHSHPECNEDPTPVVQERTGEDQQPETD